MQLIGGFRKTCERLWGLVIFGLVVSCSIALSACAAPTQYMGIEFAPAAVTGGGQSEIQSLARRAQAGDKQAQLELGIRFEEGRGVPVNLGKARDLYFKAATKKGALIPVYIATPGGRSGSIMNYSKARSELSGLNEAVVRWARVTDRISGMSRNEARNESYQTKDEFLQIYDDEDAFRSAVEELEYQHVQMPIFRGLLSRQKPWQEALVSNEPVTAVSSKAVFQTLNLLMKKQTDFARRKPSELDQSDIQSFCSEMKNKNDNDSQYFRTAALCYTAFPIVFSDKWSTLFASIEKRLESSGGLEAIQLQNLVNDAILAFRLSNLCDCNGLKASQKYQELLLSAVRKIKECSSSKCRGYGYFELFSTSANFALLVLEAPHHFKESNKTKSALVHALLPVQASAAISTDLRAIERSPRSLCSDAGYTYRSDGYAYCRQKYPYFSSLDAAVRKIAARFMLSDKKAAACSSLKSEMGVFREEFSYRSDLQPTVASFIDHYCG